MSSLITYRCYFMINFFTALIFSSLVSTSFAIEVPIYNFPIDAYSQNINDYLSPNSENYNKSLLTSMYQSLQLKEFYNHYYSSDAQSLSPWSKQMIKSVSPIIKKTELAILDEFNNETKSNANRHYGENFKEHGQDWWEKIKGNMDLEQVDAHTYTEENRAIAINNTFARALPETAPDFFHASLPGQGFPFDNLQESAIWAGTPLYVFSVSKDKAWSLVITPDNYFAWVRSNDIAYASPEFVQQWQQAAHTLAAVTQTEASIVNSEQQFQFSGYIGAVFPMVERNNQQTTILIPVKNSHNQAIIEMGIINSNASSKMPLEASPKNIATIITQLQNRPYGWGGVFFYNDCSQELKSLFTPLGIWLPRNSAQQAQLSAVFDLSKGDVDARLAGLKEKGHPLMTIIYIKGHVMLYVGDKENPITYQQVWGMSPSNKDKRYVIGQSLFLPLLKSYPESPDATSFANKSNFKLIYLDQLSIKSESPLLFASKFLLRKENH
jgi:hypothetical protein